MAEITSIILHYNRPDNVTRWMEGIKNQTVESKIIVWDNSGDYPAGSGEDVLIKSTENFYCLPKVLLTGLVQTKYTFWQDDDKAINDSKLFEKLIAECDKEPNAWIGWNGRILDNINWEKPYSYPGCGFVGKTKGEADIINTGVSFFQTMLINELPLNPFNELTETEYKFGDDMWISYWMSQKRIVDFMENSFDDLPEGNGLSKQSEHMNVRDELTRRYFK